MVLTGLEAHLSQHLLNKQSHITQKYLVQYSEGRKEKTNHNTFDVSFMYRSIPP